MRRCNDQMCPPAKFGSSRTFDLWDGEINSRNLCFSSGGIIGIGNEVSCSSGSPFSMTGANSANVNASTPVLAPRWKRAVKRSDHQSAFRNLAHLLIRTCPRTHRRSAEWAGSHVVCPVSRVRYPDASSAKVPTNFTAENTSSHSRHIHAWRNAKQEFRSFDSVPRRLLTVPLNSPVKRTRKSEIFDAIDLTAFGIAVWPARSSQRTTARADRRKILQMTVTAIYTPTRNIHGESCALCKS